MAVKNIAIGTGRRKTSVARVFVREGSGKIVVNGKDVAEYFPTEAQVRSEPASVSSFLRRIFSFFLCSIAKKVLPLRLILLKKWFVLIQEVKKLIKIRKKTMD